MLPWFNHVAKVRIFSLPPNVYSKFKTFSMSSLLLMRYVWPLTSTNPYLAKAHTVGGQPSSPKVITFFDVEKSEWRSCQIQSLLKVCDNHDLCHSMLQMSVVRIREIISTFVGSSNWHIHIGKCFLRLCRKCGSFLCRGQRTALILGIFHCERTCCVLMSHIYTECGALGRLLLHRSYHNHRQGKRNQPHTFLFYNRLTFFGAESA